MFIDALKEIKKLTSDVYLKEQGEPATHYLFHRLHNEDYLGSHDDKHVCLACGLQESLDKIERFLSQSLKNNNPKLFDIHVNPETDEEIEYVFTIYLLLLYLIVEKLHTIFKVIGITWEYVEGNWPVLVEIRKWANFVKHPKGFMFTHHPSYVYETLSYDKSDKRTKFLTYENFISTLYSREDANKFKETIKQAANKDNIVVVLPCPERLAREFGQACLLFCEKIKDNEHFKEVLKDHVILDIDPAAL